MTTAFNVVLFDDFETLDAFGPVEIIGIMEEAYKLDFYSINGGIVESSQHVRVDTLPLSEIDTTGILLIPGGMGTRGLVGDGEFIGRIKELSQKALYVLTVCTGSALLAGTGLLDGKKSTSNKRAFEWVRSVGTGVAWIRQARWVRDGKFYTSSGVSAGMDMTLGFIRDIHGNDKAVEICGHIEYVWNEDNWNGTYTGS